MEIVSSPSLFSKVLAASHQVLYVNAYLSVLHRSSYHDVIRKLYDSY